MEEDKGYKQNRVIPAGGTRGQILGLRMIFYNKPKIGVLGGFGNKKICPSPLSAQGGWDF